MNIAVIGTGNIGTTLGRSLSTAGHDVIFGSHHPDDEIAGHEDGMQVADVSSAIDGNEVVLVTIPASAVETFAAENGELLSEKLVLDVSNKVGGDVVNAQQTYQRYAPGARYARVFNCLGVEILQNPVFDGIAADMFFASADADRDIVGGLVSDVGLRPVFVGNDASTVDGVFRLWIALAMGQQRGRQLAFRTLERQ